MTRSISAILIVALFGLAGCLPIKPGKNKYCGYWGMKRFSDICKDGLTCFRDGVCRVPLAEGTLCAGEGECQGHLKCECRDDDCYRNGGVCVARYGVSERCNSYDDCRADLYCHIDEDRGAREGVCTERLLEGDGCRYSKHCRAGLFCAAGECTRQYGDGARCGSEDECLQGTFCIEGYCTTR